MSERSERRGGPGARMRYGASAKWGVGMSDPTSFGRVDDDGTVYVKTAAGERVVGSWHAGTPEEGLAHFARRFADIVTEVDLLEARLNSGAADAGHSLTTIRRIRGGLDERPRRR